MKRILIVAAALAVCACAPKYDEGEVSYRFWDSWNENVFPDFSSLGDPSDSGKADNFHLIGHSDDAVDHFAASFNSVMSIPAEEEYYFYLTSDDGCLFTIDGESVIDHRDAHGRSSVAKKTLSAGRHKLCVDYYEYTGRQRLRLMVGKPGSMPHEYGGEGPVEETPAFVMEQAAVAAERFKAWKGSDETVLFPILTDVHSHDRYSYQHVGFIAEADEVFDYDFMLNLGDIGLNIGFSHISKDFSNIVKALTRAEMDKYEGVFLYAAGNHDWDAGEGDFHSSQELSDLFQKPALKYAGGNLHLTPGKVYCYYDIPEKNFRIILLNSEGTETQQDKYYYFDEEQVQWLRSLLDETPDDMTVVLACHYMPHPNGRWHNIPAPYTLKSNEDMMALLAEYKKTKNIVGLFCGDSHFNMHEVDNGVNYYISQGLGICTDEQLMPGTRHAVYDYSETLCCDVIAVKPEKHIVHTFRIGAGGAEFDYEFTY